MPIYIFTWGDIFLYLTLWSFDRSDHWNGWKKITVELVDGTLAVFGCMCARGIAAILTMVICSVSIDTRLPWVCSLCNSLISLWRISCHIHLAYIRTEKLRARNNIALKVGLALISLSTLFNFSFSHCRWLWTWHFKALIDIVEDVLPQSWSPQTDSCFKPYIPWIQSVLRLVYLICGGIACFFVPAHEPTICIAFGTMLVGSLMAGGVDTPTWQLLACVCGVGVARGISNLQTVATVTVWVLPLWNYHYCI